jgi:hypothetical protein
MDRIVSQTTRTPSGTMARKMLLQPMKPVRMPPMNGPTESPA